MSEKRISRRTIYVGDALNTMLTTGSVAGTSHSERLDRLAARYAAIVQEMAPQRWSVGDWLTVISALKGMTVNQPLDAMVLGVRLKQFAKLKGGDSAAGTLVYKVESLRLAELLAVVDIAERAIAAGASAPESLTEWLQVNQVVAA